MANAYDLVVIGGGPGGYVAAIRAAQLGMKTACIEMRETLGGTCLNVGCIPSKALLHASERYADMGSHMEDWGVTTTGLSLDLKKMMTKKDDVVTGLTGGIAGLFKKNKVDWLQGRGEILAPGKVAVDGGEPIEATHILIATGSEVTPLPGIDIDEERIVSSTGALELASVPDQMVVIGGGVIGLELGSVWMRLGANVTVIEFQDMLLPGMDTDVRKEFKKILTKQGMNFRMGQKVTHADVGSDGVTLSVEPAAGGDAETLAADVVLSAVGRRPYTQGLGLEALGVVMDQRGFVEVDQNYQTNVAGVYAIGDVIKGPMLAHKAEEDGVVAVERMVGQQPHVDYNLVPGIVYTAPEVASVGATEDQLKAGGVDYRVGKFPFLANSRARAVGHTDGFVKMLADATTDRVLGVHIVGHDAGTLIHECAAVMEFGGSSEDIARTCHGHPTLNEAIKEAALAVDKRPIHI